ncbi:hypothetical protein PIB30_057280 [Stylosanthes scabra]|uniref:Uncharacterized protein n=1 Tax=Stylosanthes scabra TaxID=79078 RepID=A0ABU6RK14_9FABA|nr:hypothetical protein [Stylosanthes scabra]
MDGNSTFMNGQGWDPSQIGFEAMFETLVQERAKILENQKRLEAQLLTVAELASSVFGRSAPPMSPCQEESLGTITLRSRTQLKGPTGESANSDSITSEERNLQRNVEHRESHPLQNKKQLLVTMKE